MAQAAHGVVESPSLEEPSEEHADVALRDVVRWHGCDGLMVGLGDLSGLSNLSDSVSL